MKYYQIILVCLASFCLILAILNFLHLNLSILVSKRIRQFLNSQNERIAYQKAIALPYAVLGLFTLLLSYLCLYHTQLFFLVYFVSISIFLVWTLTINKKYLGWYFPNRHQS